MRLRSSKSDRRVFWRRAVAVAHGARDGSEVHTILGGLMDNGLFHFVADVDMFRTTGLSV